MTFEQDEPYCSLYFLDDELSNPTNNYSKNNFLKLFCLTLRKFSKKLSFYLLSLKLAALNVWSDIISPKMHFDLIYFKTMWVGFLFLMAKKLPHNNIHLKSV